MNFKQYLLLMGFGTLAAWATYVIVLLTTDPTRASTLGFVLFYITLALAMVGTLAIGGSVVRVWLRPQELVWRHVSRAFRQAILVSILLVICLLLTSYGLFHAWTGILLVLAAALAELAFISQHHSRPLT